MKIVAIKGGLGNQLFQYALGRYLSVNLKEEIKIDNGVNSNRQDTYRKYTLDNFNITLPLATKEEVKKNKYRFGLVSKIWRGVKAKIFRIYNIGFQPNILKTKEKYLEGFWQSPKYSDQIRDILLKEFTLKNPLSSFAKTWQDKILKSDNSISIHIRRGDYIQNKKTNKFHGSCDEEYYKNALELITKKINKENAELFIFSDDIDWAKENLHFNFPTNFVSDNIIPDYEEMYLMSLCKNNIIANSSFSWWGAWLNQNSAKMIVAPKQWTTNRTANELGVLPKTWQQI